MRMSFLSRLFLALVLLFNGLAAAHAFAAPGGDAAMHADVAETGCHDRQKAATSPSDSPVGGVHGESHSPACCQDLCQCACALQALAGLPPPGVGPWGAVTGPVRLADYLSVSPAVLLRPPIA